MRDWTLLDGDDTPTDGEEEEQLDPGEPSHTVPSDIGVRIGEGTDPVEDQIL